MSQLGIMWPAYQYPTGAGATAWAAAATACATVPVIVIANPASGPGTSTNSDYVTVIANHRAAGGLVVGYVRTDYGNSRGLATVAQIKANIDAWKLYYSNADGIFLDEHENGSEDLLFYQEVVAHFRTVFPSGIIVGNAGASLDEDYIASSDACDIYVIYENDGSPAVSAPAYAVNYDRGRFGTLQHTTAEADGATYVTASYAANVGWVYPTDDNYTPNPWNVQSTYFAATVTQIAAINALAPRGPHPRGGMFLGVG